MLTYNKKDTTIYIKTHTELKEKAIITAKKRGYRSLTDFMENLLKKAIEENND